MPINLKILLIEKQNKIDFKIKNTSINYQLYALNKIKLKFLKFYKINKIKYDIIIKTRPNFLFTKKINFEKLLNKLYIILPKKLSLKYYGGINICFFSNFNIMMKTFLIYENLSKLKQNTIKPESIYKDYYDKSKIDISFLIGFYNLKPFYNNKK